MDRLTRNLEELEILMKMFEDNTVNIFLCKGEEASSLSSFQLGILEAMANFETQIREERELIDSAIEEFVPA